MKEFKSIIKEIKEHHHSIVKLILWMAIGQIGATLVAEGLSVLFPSGSTLYLVISFLFFVCKVVVLNTIMFLFIQNVRGESFHVKDIVASGKMVVYHIGSALVLALMQSIFQQTAILWNGIPYASYTFIFLIQGMFFCWNGIIAFAIYEQNRSFKDYFGGALLMMKNNWQLILALCVPYALLCVISNEIAATIFLQVFESTKSFSMIITSLTLSQSSFMLIFMTYLIYYGLQILIISWMLLMIAHLYDRYASIYLIHGKGKAYE